MTNDQKLDELTVSVNILAQTVGKASIALAVVGAAQVCLLAIIIWRVY